MLAARTRLHRLITPALASRHCTTAPHFPLWVDGAAAEARDGATLPVEDPSTAEPFATTALGSEADIDDAVASAKACHEAGLWRGMGARGRGRVLRGAATLLRERLASLVEAETRATGRPRREFEAQLGRVPEWLEYHASLAESMEGSVPPFSDATDHLAIVRRRPLGVCGLITPWNHPLLIATKKVSVALATGNTVVVKPPELAPGSVVERAAGLKVPSTLFDAAAPSVHLVAPRAQAAPTRAASAAKKRASTSAARLSARPRRVRFQPSGAGARAHRVGRAAGNDQRVHRPRHRRGPRARATPGRGQD